MKHYEHHSRIRVPFSRIVGMRARKGEEQIRNDWGRSQAQAMAKGLGMASKEFEGRSLLERHFFKEAFEIIEWHAVQTFRT